MSENCDHKFVHRNNEGFYCPASRYSMKYTSVDYYFCEKCLEEKEVKKEVTLNDHEIPHKLPDWAKLITTKVRGWE